MSCDHQRMLPFEGLHVYQRAQEAWRMAEILADLDCRDVLASRAEKLLGEAVEALAAGTAAVLPGQRVGFGVARERVHAAAAVLDQRVRRGVAEATELRAVLIDAGRMLGSLMRALGGREEGR